MPYFSLSMSFYKHHLSSLKPSCFACIAWPEWTQHISRKEWQYYTLPCPSKVTTAETWALCHPTHSALLHFFLTLHMSSFNQTPLPFAEVQLSIFSLSNSRLWEQKLCSLANQTEMNTYAYRNTGKTSICSSTWQKQHRFSLTCVFSLLRQGFLKVFSFPKRRKSAFLWSNPIIFDSEIRQYYAYPYSAKLFSSFLWYNSLHWQDMRKQHCHLSQMLCLSINTILGPFHPEL